MSLRELEAIPTAAGALVDRHQEDALHRLVAARRRLDQLADEARSPEIDVDQVDAALDAYDDAQALAGEWVAHWKRRR